MFQCHYSVNHLHVLYYYRSSTLRCLAPFNIISIELVVRQELENLGGKPDEDLGLLEEKKPSVCFNLLCLTSLRYTNNNYAANASQFCHWESYLFNMCILKSIRLLLLDNDVSMFSAGVVIVS